MMKLLASFCLTTLASAFALAPQECSPAIANPASTSSNYLQPLYASSPPCESMQWTHPPICHDAAVQEHFSAPEERFCLYTDSTFANSRGVSFITTPEIAMSLTWEDKELAETGLKNVTKHPWYDERETPSMGKGLFANRSIPAGTVTIVKSPILVIMQDAFSALEPSKRSKLQEKGLQRLSQETQDLIHSMAASHGLEDKLDDYIKTNAIQQAYGPQNTRHLSLIPEAARINHACRPNGYYRCKSTCLNLEAFTLFPVRVGEELTFSYGFGESKREERLEGIRERWAFNCTCPLCEASVETRKKSDERLGRISAILNMLPKRADVASFIELLPVLIELMEEEGIVTSRPRFMEILAYSYSQAGDEEKTKFWAGRAGKEWGVIAGEDSWEVRRCRELEKDVRGHPSWGTYGGAE